jgi:hypothetical protein
MDEEYMIVMDEYEFDRMGFRPMTRENQGMVEMERWIGWEINEGNGWICNIEWMNREYGIEGWRFKN